MTVGSHVGFGNIETAFPDMADFSHVLGSAHEICTFMDVDSLKVHVVGCGCSAFRTVIKNAAVRKNACEPGHVEYAFAKVLRSVVAVYDSEMDVRRRIRIHQYLVISPVDMALFCRTGVVTQEAWPSAVGDCLKVGRT